ncbi:GNAT family N-acetyltransferase [Mucilaginibacter sp. Bleaf8]|uniref:GNAT family N-acetyltransferase n=1 Tax=Mucilaginibacter sp. Bleaf8 TaxID=2834430 RepID=UPI001BCB05B6|nr:GNAT family N-acetyltransferase [Mucilaginibacter sp. Bleaf8]MBS7563282.1 GNAT family N-acetyltransferase [Mucilaginibacter sp. Bleaf8]
MTNYTIRPVEERDNKIIASVIRTVLSEFGVNKPGTVYTDPTTDDLYSLFKQPQSAYWVVEMNGVIVGGAGIYPTDGLPEGYCEMVKLYLLPQTRGLGIGKALIQQCFIKAAQLGFKYVYLESMPELSGAISLYRKMGFQHLTAPLGNSGHFACDIWMVKALN